MTNNFPLHSQDIAGSIVRALVLYSLAEFQAGHAKTIRVTAAERSFSVGDDGRGHAVSRLIAGSPYLKFVYSHLEYPFDLDDAPPVQLQGMGISLINLLCSDLSVIIQKPDLTVRLSFRHGQSRGHETLAVISPATGNTVVGTVSSQFQARAIDTDALRHWCQSILAANPRLALFWDDVQLSV
jgi:DNA gyrase/topoisomerase IV subunit B